jgi:hypothetical protein
VGWATHPCCLAGSLAWASDQAGPAGPSPLRPCWLGSTQPPKKRKKKESESDLAFRQNTPLCLGHNFYTHFSLIFGQTSPFSISENFKNIWGSLLIYLWAPRTLIYFFLCVLYFFLSYVLNLWPIIVKCKSVVQYFFYFRLKRTNNNKG